jgi:hypothetical protein
MRLSILLLMLFWHHKKDPLNLFLLGGQLHCHAEEPFLEVAEELP